VLFDKDSGKRVAIHISVWVCVLCVCKCVFVCVYVALCELRVGQMTFWPENFVRRLA